MQRKKPKGAAGSLHATETHLGWCYKESQAVPFTLTTFPSHIFVTNPVILQTNRAADTESFPIFSRYFA